MLPLLWSTLALFAPQDAAPAPTPYVLSGPEQPVRGQPYLRAATADRFGRRVEFFLSEPRGRAALPVVVYVQGSGCGSLFAEVGGRVVPAAGHITAAEVLAGRAHLLAVEKPGVEFLSSPRDCADAAAFHREHTLERWSEAVAAALRAAWTLERVDRGRTLVVGHSEGGLVACRVARELGEDVTHVASLAGGGPSQLYDLISLARRGEFFAHVSSDPEERVDHVLQSWSVILEDPRAEDRFFLGFAHRRWSSFLASSPIEELRASRARVYLAQGGLDTAVDPTSADALYAQLVAAGADVTYDRLPAADHSFLSPERPDEDGWRALFERLALWFLE